MFPPVLQNRYGPGFCCQCGVAQHPDTLGGARQAGVGGGAVYNRFTPIEAVVHGRYDAVLMDVILPENQWR